jgi:hypothetical protein
VHITLWVILALLKHKKIYVEDKMYEFGLNDILAKGCRKGNQSDTPQERKGLL